MTTTPQENKDLVRQIPEEINTKGRLELVDDIFAEDFVEHGGPLGEITSREDIRAGFEMFQDAFPDATVSVEDLVAEGDRVAMRVSIRGTHEGPFTSIDPTGNTVEIEGTIIHRIEDGRVAERWTNLDGLGMMQQLGVVELPEE